MRKMLVWAVTMLSLATSTLAAYNATYGKVDNMEMGFDMMWDTAVGIAPYMLLIAAGLGVAWALNRTGILKWN